MASAKDRLTIFENVIARVGLDGDVLGEYSKAMSALNGLQTFTEMNPPALPASNNIAPNVDNMQQNPQNGGVAPPMGDSGSEGLNMP